MKEVNYKGILDNDMVISAENVQKMGKVIALICIKMVIVRSCKDLHYLYKWLLRDMNRTKEDYSPFSNAYDIVQEAILFLCQHIGEKLGDNYTTKYGKIVTIKSACYRCSDNYLQKQYTRHLSTTINIDEPYYERVCKNTWRRTEKRLYSRWRAYIKDETNRRGIRNAFYSYGRVYNVTNK